MIFLLDNRGRKLINWWHLFHLNRIWCFSNETFFVLVELILKLFNFHQIKQMKILLKSLTKFFVIKSLNWLFTRSLKKQIEIIFYAHLSSAENTSTLLSLFTLTWLWYLTVFYVDLNMLRHLNSLFFFLKFMRNFLYQLVNSSSISLNYLDKSTTLFCDLLWIKKLWPSVIKFSNRFQSINYCNTR